MPMNPTRTFFMGGTLKLHIAPVPPPANGLSITQPATVAAPNIHAVPFRNSLLFCFMSSLPFFL